MQDLYYLGGSMLFFALMLMYANACERLGRGAASSVQGDAS